MYKNMYIYIRNVAGSVLLCECPKLLHSFPVHGDLLSTGMWCGSTRTPWEHWTGAQTVPGSTLAVPQCCARAQKALNSSNAVMEAAVPPVPLHVLAHFVFRLVKNASFSTKKNDS